MTQFFYRFTKGGGSTVTALYSVLACSVGGFGQEVGKGLLMSAEEICIYIYIISMQALGVLQISGLIHSLIKLVLTSPA